VIHHASSDDLCEHAAALKNSDGNAYAVSKLPGHRAIHGSCHQRHDHAMAGRSSPL
jgi:hypothetical protein